MPHYYFHLWKGGQLAADEAGCALPGPEAARRKAEAVAFHLIRQSAWEAGGRSGWDVEVTDEAGRTVLFLSLDDVEQGAVGRRAA